MKYLFVFILLVNILLYSLNEPKEPEVNDVKDPVFFLTNNDINETVKPDKPLLYKVLLEYKNKTKELSLISLTNNQILYITNIISNTLTIKVMTLFDISRIEILRWKHIDLGESLYYFIPVVYKIYPLKEKRVFYLYSNNIEILNEFHINPGSENRKGYTVFYDRWLKGSKNIFRWQNSKKDNFNYNYENPLDNVIVCIDFLTFY